MMSAWAVSVDNPLRHPWFSHPSLKRKHSESSDEDTGRNSGSDQEGVPSFYPTPPPENMGCVDNDGERVDRKRRRRDTIERRMARMYIDGTNASQPSATYTQCRAWNIPFVSTIQSTASNTSHAYTAGSISPVSQSDLIPQYSVEEPVSPEFKDDLHAEPSLPLMQPDETPITEVRMKGAEPAWYEREKDRIVITDLDEAVEEAEHEEYKSEAEPHPDATDHADSNADYSISAVLLDHIKQQANFPYVAKSSREEKSGALVLFRPHHPLPIFSRPSSDHNTQKDGEDDGVRVEEIDESEALTFTPSGNYAVGTVSMDQEREELEVGEPMDMDMDVEL